MYCILKNQKILDELKYIPDKRQQTDVSIQDLTEIRKMIGEGFYLCKQLYFKTDKNEDAPELLKDIIENINTKENLSRHFLFCVNSFKFFKEGESYWFEWTGEQKYSGRSDNILGKSFELTNEELFKNFSIDI